MRRAKRIEEKILDKMYKNGGHWVELDMKDGDKIRLKRQNFQSFEDLHKEKFIVKVNSIKIMDKVSIEEVSDYINRKY